MHSTEISSTLSCLSLFHVRNLLAETFFPNIFFFLSQRVFALVIKQQHSTEIIMFSIVCHNFALTFRLFCFFFSFDLIFISLNPALCMRDMKDGGKVSPELSSIEQTKRKTGSFREREKILRFLLLISDTWTWMSFVESDRFIMRCFVFFRLLFKNSLVNLYDCWKTESSVGVNRPSSKNNKGSIAIFRSLFNPSEYLFYTHFTVGRTTNENRHKFSTSFDC